MKKIICNVFIAVILLFILTFLTGCSSNAIIGKWSGKSDSDIETTFDFKGNGDVHYNNEYGMESDGKYEIVENMIIIKLETWETEKTYKYEIEDGKLNLKATETISPSYIGMEKQ